MTSTAEQTESKHPHLLETSHFLLYIIFGKCVPKINFSPSIIPPKKDAREKGKRRTPWASSKVVATCCFPAAAMEQWKQNLSYLPLYWLVHDGILMSYRFYNPPIIGWYHPLYKLHNLVAAQPWSHWKSWLLPSPVIHLDEVAQFATGKLVDFFTSRHSHLWSQLQ